MQSNNNFNNATTMNDDTNTNVDNPPPIFVESIYIPSIDKSTTEEMVVACLFPVASVRRVDFVALKEGTPAARKFKSAFVYFNGWNLGSQYTFEILQTLGRKECYSFYRSVNNRPAGFWKLCPNKKPVNDSSMNIHQLEEATHILTGKVVEITEKHIVGLSKRIQDLEDKIAEMTKKDDDIQNSNGETQTDDPDPTLNPEKNTNPLPVDDAIFEQMADAVFESASNGKPIECIEKQQTPSPTNSSVLSFSDFATPAENVVAEFGNCSIQNVADTFSYADPKTGGESEPDFGNFQNATVVIDYANKSV
jgi:hypothetical protein